MCIVMSLSNCKALLRTGRLIPSVVSSFNATIGPLLLTYPQGIVNYGNNLTLSSVMYNPTISFPSEPAFPDAVYTVLMIDPDAPTPQNPTSALIRHWLVSDVAPTTTPANISSGNVLSAYRSPSPPANSTAHRYLTLLLRQMPSVPVSLGNQTAIQSFNLNAFIQQNSLIVVSGNYFNASRTNTSTTSNGNTNSTRSASGNPASTSDANVFQLAMTSFVLCTLLVIFVIH